MTIDHSARTLLVVTWEPPKRIRPAAHFWDQAFRTLKFKRCSVHVLHSLGSIVSYHKVDTRFWDSNLSHPHNMLYGFHEPYGTSLILTCFSNVWKTAEVQWTPIIDAAGLIAAEECVTQSAITPCTSQQFLAGSHTAANAPNTFSVRVKDISGSSVNAPSLTCRPFRSRLLGMPFRLMSPP